jgi:hypothetical protein
VPNIFKLRIAVAVPLLATVLAGCDLQGDGADCGGIRPIEDIFDASVAAGDIASTVESALVTLADGSYTDRLILGYTGSISITGDISRSLNQSCGTVCETTFNNHDIIATLTDYSVGLGDPMVNGIVDYSDTTGSTQSGLSYFTSGSISISDNGLSISYDSTIYDSSCKPSTVGLIDTISAISSSGSSSSSSDQGGILTASGGSFTF